MKNVFLHQMSMIEIYKQVSLQSCSYNFAIFTGKHLRWSFFLIKLQGLQDLSTATSAYNRIRLSLSTVNGMKIKNLIRNRIIKVFFSINTTKIHFRYKY